MFLLWVVAMLTAHDYSCASRAVAQVMNTETKKPLPQLSVIITAYDQAEDLRRHLPAILQQDYPHFEVFVVDVASKDDTRKLLEDLAFEYQHLRFTTLPSSTRDISLQRLALALGFRAASNEWVVITSANCEPASPHWLQRIGEAIVNPVPNHIGVDAPDIVIGHAAYRPSPERFRNKANFNRLWQALMNTSHVLAGYAAVRADACNVAIRRSLFLDSNGFGEDHNLKAGAEELMVNRLSTNTNTALLLHPEGLVLQDAIPDEAIWHRMQTFYAETRRHQRHNFIYRMRCRLFLIMPWTMVVLFFFAIYLSMLFGVRPNDYWLIIVAALLLMMLSAYIVFKVKSFNTAVRLSSHPQDYRLTFLSYELLMPFWLLSARLARLFAPKKEFRKKFV